MTSFEFLYLARLHRRKRPAVLVEAATLLARTTDKPIEVAFVGPDEGEESEVRRQIQASGSSEWIRVEGPLEPGSTLERMRRASVYVLPSVDEPFPMSVLEAMSVGVPVIVTDSCGLAPFIAESGAGIVCDSSVQGLSEALRRFVEEPGLRESCSAAAVELARESFSMDGVTRQLEDVYRSLTSHTLDHVVEGSEVLKDTDGTAGNHVHLVEEGHGAGLDGANQFWHRAEALAEFPAYGEERLVVLNLERGSPLVLLGSANAIWDLIDGTRTEADILKELTSAYLEADGLAIAEHLRKFLAELSFRGLAGSRRQPAVRGNAGAGPRY